MSDPVVSVIVPCYRQARWLGCCIESVLGQSYQAVQLLVVNDGSDDDTETVALRYRRYIHYLTQANGGVSSARNAGIRASDGSYLLFLDADDVLEPNAITQLVHAARAREDTFCLMGYSTFEGDPVVGRQCDFVPPANLCSLLPASLQDDPMLAGQFTSLPPDDRSLLPYLLYTCVWPPACVLCSKKRVVAEGGFEESLRNCEEWDLWLRLALTGVRLATVRALGALYRRHPTSKSSDFRRMLEARTELLLRAHRRIVQRPELLRLWGRDLLQAEIRVRRRYLARGKWSSKVRRLSERILELRKLGIALNANGRSNRFLELLPGVCGDRAVLAHYRWFRPTVLAYYRSCYD